MNEMKVTDLMHGLTVDVIHDWSIAGDSYKADTRKLLRRVMREQNVIRGKRLTDEEIEDTVMNDVVAQTLTYVLSMLKIDLPSAVAYVRAMTDDGKTNYKPFDQKEAEKYYDPTVTEALPNNSRLLLKNLDTTVAETVHQMIVDHVI